MSLMAIPRKATVGALMGLLAVMALQGASAAGSTSTIDSDQRGKADLIIVNGKVVTMDDRTASGGVGTVATAMAVKDGRIVALQGKGGRDGRGKGDANSSVMALKGPGTKVINLKGRTVTPGIIDTHSHAHEYAVDNHGQDLVDTFPEMKVSAVEGSTPEELLDNIKTTLEARVSDAQPGDWIRMTLSNRNAGLQVYNDGRLSREFLDPVAPDNPVHVNIATSHIVNTAGWNELEALYGEGLGLHPEGDPEQGRLPHTPWGRALPQLMILNQDPRGLQEVTDLIESELREDVTYGVTSMSSSLSEPLSIAALQELNRRGDMPLRLGWGHSTNPVSPSFYRSLGDIRNLDSNSLWNDGVSLASVDKAYPRICSTVPVLADDPGAICFLDKGSIMRETLESMIASGYRFSNTHVAGDKALDQLLDVIEEASARAGLSKEQIRARAHTVDHCTLNPRPDQIPRLKDLGIIISCEPKYINDTSPQVKSTAGEEYLRWVVPAKSLIDGDVRLASGVDYHFSSDRSVFWLLDLLVNRQADDGTVYAPEERINRVQALKTFTTWASEYVQKESEIGTLEEGKLADFIVLDRDYFSIPEGDVPSVKVVMSVVGGKVSWQSKEF
ncbi:MAG: amidohydrolase family protein [Streptosporangiales bacterium]|nr:amidohydrolase family protein [Streptosporangiales bacterium]